MPRWVVVGSKLGGCLENDFSQPQMPYLLRISLEKKVPFSSNDGFFRDRGLYDWRMTELWKWNEMKGTVNKWAIQSIKYNIIPLFNPPQAFPFPIFVFNLSQSRHGHNEPRNANQGPSFVQDILKSEGYFCFFGVGQRTFWALKVHVEGRKLFRLTCDESRSLYLYTYMEEVIVWFLCGSNSILDNDSRIGCRNYATTRRTTMMYQLCWLSESGIAADTDWSKSSMKADLWKWSDGLWSGGCLIRRLVVDGWSTRMWRLEISRMIVEVLVSMLQIWDEKPRIPPLP